MNEVFMNGHKPLLWYVCHWQPPCWPCQPACHVMPLPKRVGLFEVLLCGAVSWA